MRRLLAAALLAPAMIAQPASLQTTVDAAARSTLTRFAPEKLKPEEIALKDRPLQLFGLLWILTFAVGVLVD